MQEAQFVELVTTVTAAIAGRPLDRELESELNRLYPAGGEFVARIAEGCHVGSREGWVCGRESAGIKFGRVPKPGPALHGFSIDVVDMADIVGPHHEHPRGEIDLVIPMNEGARFDGRDAGWLVYGPGSAHQPTVSGGRAFVLYLLPGGEIRFTGQ